VVRDDGRRSEVEIRGRALEVERFAGRCVERAIKRLEGTVSRMLYPVSWLEYELLRREGRNRRSSVWIRAMLAGTGNSNETAALFLYALGSFRDWQLRIYDGYAEVHPVVSI